MIFVIDPFCNEVSRLFEGMWGLAAEDISQSRMPKTELLGPPFTPLLPPPFPI